MASSTSGTSPTSASGTGFGGFDAQEMVIVHHAFRRKLRLIGELIAAVRPGDAKEFGAPGEHFVMSTPKTKLFKYFGMVMQDADERERAILLGGLPAPVRLVWRAPGPRLYARTMGRVRATT